MSPHSKVLIKALYVLIFWILLPALLISASYFLDRTLHLSVSFSYATLIAGILIASLSGFMWILSLYQYIKMSNTLPISAFPPGHLIQNGVYSIWRHPIYLFFTLLLIGLSLVVKSGAMLTIVLPMFVIGEAFYIFYEEKQLVKRFGLAYEGYRRRSSLVFPRLPHVLQVPACFLFKMLLSYKIVNKENIPRQPPFFVVSSHRNYFDAFIITTALKMPIRCITTYEVFRNPLSRIIFRRLLCIAKKRYMVDFRAGKEIIKAIHEKSVIVVFPEAERSWTGKIGSFKSESLKLLRKFHLIPVLPLKLEGNYHSWPRWGKNIRRAKLTVVIQKPFYVNPDVKLDILEKQLKKCVTPEDHNAVCRSNDRARNIGLVIYRCPLCREFEPFEVGTKSDFRCTYCNRVFQLLPDYSIQYRDHKSVISRSIDELYNDIRINIRDLTSSRMRFTEGDRISLDRGERVIASSEICIFYQEKKGTLLELLRGACFLTNKRLLFRNRKDSITLDLDQISSVTIESNYKLQIYVYKKNLLYQVIFKNQSALKWQDYIVEILRYELDYLPNTK